MINLHTKFEVSALTHYKDMEDNAKCRNWVLWSGYGSSKVIGIITI